MILLFSPSAASGNIVIVQTLCERKCPVNVRDMVCMPFNQIQSSSLIQFKLLFV